jgi:hypothetical protein
MHNNDLTDAIRKIFSEAKECRKVNKTLTAGGHGRNNCSLYKTEEAENTLLQIFHVDSQNVHSISQD